MGNDSGGRGILVLRVLRYVVFILNTLLSLLVAYQFVIRSDYIYDRFIKDSTITLVLQLEEDVCIDVYRDIKMARWNQQ